MYRFGAQKEREIVNKLRKEGWFAVRTPKSGTAIDIVAIRKNPFNNQLEVKLIQVKASRKKEPKVSEDEKERLKDLARMFGGTNVSVELWLVYKDGSKYQTKKIQIKL